MLKQKGVHSMQMNEKKKVDRKKAMKVTIGIKLRRGFLVVVCGITCFTFSESSSQITFQKVQQCPLNNKTWNARKELFHCSDQSSTYHCMKKAGGGFAEFCRQRQGISPNDGCPILHAGSDETNIIQITCRRLGCPNAGDYFTTDELYKYPACLENENTGNSQREEVTSATEKERGSTYHAETGITDIQLNLAQKGGISAAAVGFVILVASICGLIRYVKGLNNQAEDARYLHVPSFAFLERNSHLYVDPRIYDSTNALERGNRCEDAAGGKVKKDNLVSLDDTNRVSCNRESLYDYINEEVREACTGD